VNDFVGSPSSSSFEELYAGLFGDNDVLCNIESTPTVEEETRVKEETCVKDEPFDLVLDTCGYSMDFQNPNGSEYSTPFGPHSPLEVNAPAKVKLEYSY